MVLKAVAALLLALVILTRSLTVLSPKKAKAWLKEFSKINKDWSYAISLVMFASGLITALLVVKLAGLQSFLVSVFGAGLLAGSFLMFNDIHRDAIKLVLKKSDKWFQKVALFKLAVAVALLWALVYF
ncbi:MAG: hypothetical protein HY516_04945 [Candidatus Aenigmarchaeota archaeon]|nr:hypothetical protein [Candidatus Aenigmarchaeota archaeon]